MVYAILDQLCMGMFQALLFQMAKLITLQAVRCYSEQSQVAHVVAVPLVLIRTWKDPADR
jgi:hypothetical protein